MIRLAHFRSERSFLLVAALAGILGSGLAFPGTLLASVSAPASGKTAAAAKLMVRPAILVDQARVDATHLVGGAVSATVRETLGKIPIGMIAHPLGEMTISRPDLERKLGSMAALFELPDFVQIRRRGELLSGVELETRIRQAVAGRDKGIPLAELRIDCSRLPKNLVLPGPIERWQVSPLSNNLLGMCLFAFEATCRNGRVRQIVQVEVAREVNAARVRRLLKRGSCVTPEDVMVEAVRLTSSHAQVPLTVEQVIGRQIGVYKSPGSYIRTGDLATEGSHPCVKAESRPISEKAGVLGLEKVCSVQIGDFPALVQAQKARVSQQPEGLEDVPLHVAADGPDLAEIDTDGVAVPAAQLKTFPGEVADGGELTRPVSPVSVRNPIAGMAGVNPKSGWVVKPGDQVDFTVRRGGLTLSVPARALDGGSQGASIRLVNLQNQRQIQGVITGKGMVEYAE